MDANDAAGTWHICNDTRRAELALLLMLQHAPGEHIRKLAVIESYFTVYQYIADTGRKHRRVIEGGFVSNGLWIEDNYIRKITGFEQASFFQPEGFGG